MAAELPAEGNGFVAREWVDERVEAWLCADEPVLVICGPPGTGKTELARHLASARPETVHAHFCSARDDATLDPARFVTALAQALAAEVPGYAARVATPEGAAPTSVTGSVTAKEVREGAVAAGVYMPVSLGEASARPAFDRLVRRPLELLAGAATPPRALLVIVDALDEALTLGPGETLVQLLQSILSPGPPVPLRLLLTTRPDRRVLDRLPPPRLDLLADAPAGADDVRRYAERRLRALPTERRRALAERVAAAAAGIFLYARYVLDDLLTDPERLRDPRHIQLPGGLDAHYHEYVERELARTDEAWEKRYRPLLGLLAVARGAGLDRDLLVGATGIAPSRVDDALRRLGQYLNGLAPEGPFRIYHQSFRDFLATDDEYGAYPDEAERALADHLISVIPTSSDGERDWSTASDYARTHLASHAAAVGRLDDLLEDPGYLVAADAPSLLRALPAAASDEARAYAHAYQRAARLMRGRSAGEAAAYLELVARQDGLDRVADVIAELDLGQPWHTPFTAGRRAASHGVLRGHSGVVAAVSCGELRDGTPIAVSAGHGDDDATVRVWNLDTHTALGDPLQGHERRVRGVVGGGVRGVAWTRLRDGTPIALSAGDDGTVRVWDLDTLTPRRTPLTGHANSVNDVACGALSDGTAIAISVGNDRTVRVWNLDIHGPYGYPLEGHTNAVLSVACGRLRDGTPIAVSGGHDCTVRVWNLDSHTAHGDPLEAHTGWVCGVACGRLRDGTRIAVSGGGEDRTVRVWNLDTHAAHREPLEGHTSPVGRVAYGLLRDGTAIAVSAGTDDQVLRVWNLDAHTAYGDPLEGHTVGDHFGWVLGVACGRLRDGAPIAVSGGYDRTVRVWSLDRRARRAHRLEAHARPVRGVGCGRLRDGTRIAVSGGEDGTLRVWNLDTQAARGDPLKGHPAGQEIFGEAGVRALACGQLRDGTPVAVSGGRDCTVRVWNLETHTAHCGPLTAHATGRPLQGVLSVACGLLRDGTPIAVSGGEDGTVCVWDLDTRPRLRAALVGPRMKVHGVACGRLGDGTPVAVGASGDYMMRVWDLATGADRGQPIPTVNDEWDIPTRHPFGLTDSRLGPAGAQDSVACGRLADGTPIAALARQDGVIRIWDLANGRWHGDPLEGHEGRIWDIVCGRLRNGTALAVSAGEDGTLRVWNLAAGALLAVGDRTPLAIELGGPLYAVAIAPPSTVVVGGEIGVLALTFPLELAA